eukprot:m.47623 g.47623  ORF g.47623 m.47623 type:complete len:350 (-) comp20540_c0_seq3:60-1109(-)
MAAAKKEGAMPAFAPFRSVESMCSNLSGWSHLETLKADCKVAYEIQQETGKSFWLPHGKAPSSGLEAMAASIYQYHLAANPEAPHFTPDIKVAGAEWWVQVRGCDLEEGDAIGFHWDRDEVLADHNPPVLVHPHVATVTYLTGYGAPTVVIEQDPIVPAVAPTADPVEMLAARGVVSYPMPGKHIGFDGRLLHGVPPEAMTAPSQSDGLERVTFLVNLWLTHALTDIQPFPTVQLKRLRVPIATVAELMPWSPVFHNGAKSSKHPFPAESTCRSVKCDDFQVCGFEFGRVGDEEHQLWMPIPEMEITRGESANLIFGSQPAKVIRLPINSTTTKKKRKRKKKKKATPSS